MSTLEITPLRSLVAVAAFGGVGRAAAALHLSQPTVTAHLRRLEAELGLSLVERHGRAIAFTADGESLVRDAHRIVAVHDDAVDRITGLSSTDLLVASTDMATAAILRTAGRVLHAHHPDRRIGFRFHRTDRLREFARSHSADVVIGYGDFGSHGIRIGDVPLAWFGGANADESSLVAFTAPCTLRAAMLASPDADGRTLRRECLDLMSVLSTVRAGTGITVLPDYHRGETGLRELTHLTPPEPLPLTLVPSPRVDAETAHELVRAMRALGETSVAA